MDVVFGAERLDGWSEEHGFVVRVGENEKNVVLFVVDSSALEDVDDRDGQEVHAE